MKFSDFQLDGTVKIKPIILTFWDKGFREELEIKSIVFRGQNYLGKYLFDFYYAPGHARITRFLHEKQFDSFTKNCEVSK